MIEGEVAALKARVARLERAVAFLQERLGIQYIDELASPASEQVLALVRRGDKLGAIKLHMQQTGADLKTAKNLVDTLE